MTDRGSLEAVSPLDGRYAGDTEPGGAELAVVLANEEGAPALEGAAERGIPTEAVTRGDDSRERGRRPARRRPVPCRPCAAGSGRDSKPYRRFSCPKRATPRAK